MDTRVKKLKEQAILTGMFDNRNDAEVAYLDLLNRGYSKEDINLLISEEDLIRVDNHTTEKERGGSLSKTIGTVAGILVGTGLAAGLVIAGYDYAGIAGAGAAGTIGFIIGLLMIPGSSDEKLEIAEPNTTEDSIIIQVNPKNKDDAQYLEDEWRTHRGKMVIAIR